MDLGGVDVGTLRMGAYIAVAIRLCRGEQFIDVGRLASRPSTARPGMGALTWFQSINEIHFTDGPVS